MDGTSTVKQLQLIDAPIDSHCSLCDRKMSAKHTKLPRCKWCFKGGLGDPPMPEMAAWKTWRRGLERVLRRELKRAGFDIINEQRTVEAVLFDRGTVAPQAEAIVRPYLERICSEGRYNEARAQALLARRIYIELRKVFVDEPEEPFIARIERLRRLSRADLIEHSRHEEAKNKRLLALSWHIEDLSAVAATTVVRLRRAGVTAEQLSAGEVALCIVDRVGLDASRRLKPANFTRIALGFVAEELERRHRKVRVDVADVPALRLRVADIEVSCADVDAEVLADEESSLAQQHAPLRARLNA